MIIEIVTLFDEYLNPMSDITSKNLIFFKLLQNQNTYVLNKK
jgi:hypothetical protein